VTDTGALYTWGYNPNGNLGHGEVRDQRRPVVIQGLQGIRVVAVSTTYMHKIALAADGSVYAFGKGPGLGISQAGEGEEGVESTHIPRRIPNLVCMVP
jgi:alpha-tubulin suppressor-like RCC1 family protein